MNRQSSNAHQEEVKENEIPERNSNIDYRSHVRKAKRQALEFSKSNPRTVVLLKPVPDEHKSEEYDQAAIHKQYKKVFKYCHQDMASMSIGPQKPSEPLFKSNEALRDIVQVINLVN